MKILQNLLGYKPLSSSGVWDLIVKWCLYAVVFLTPLLFLPWTMYPLALNKQFIFTTLIFLALIAWLIKGIARGELVYAKSPLNILVLLLVLLALLSAWFSGSRTISLMGANGGEVDTFINVLSLGLLYFLIASTLKEEKELNRLFDLLIFSSVVVLIYGLLQMLEWFVLPWDFAKDKAFNSVGTSNALGVYLGLIFAIVITTRKGFWGILAAALLATVFLIGYWPVFVGLILAMIILIKSNIKNKNLLPFAVLAISIFVLLANFGFIRFRLPLFNLPAEVTPSLSVSWSIARNTIQGGVKNFILGSGPATYTYQYSRYRDTSLNNTPFWNVKFSQGYNALLTHLVNWGFLGTLLFVIFLAAILLLVFRLVTQSQRSPPFVWGIAIGLVYLILMLFFYPQNLVIYFALFVLTGLLTAAQNQTSGDNRSISLVGSPRTTFIFSLTAMISVMLATSILYINGQRYLGAIYFARGVQLANVTGNIDQAMPHLLSGLNLDSKNDTYLQTLATAFLVKVSDVLNKPNASPADLQAEFARNVGAAIEAARQSTVVNPSNSLNWLGLARVYESIILLVPGAADQAFAAYNQAAKLEPNNPLIYSNWGRAYIAAADRLSQELTPVNKEKRDEMYGQAIVSFDEALNLKPDYAPAHFSLVQVFDRQGKTEEAIARAERLRAVALTDANPTNDVGILFQLGLLHYQAKRFNRAKEMLEGAVGLSPDYSNARYFLGLIYDKEGNRSRASEQFEKISKLNADNEEVKKILLNLRAGQPALSGIIENIQERKTAPIENRRPEVLQTSTSDSQ